MSNGTVTEGACVQVSLPQWSRDCDGPAWWPARCHVEEAHGGVEMRDGDRWRSEARPLDRRHGTWPGGHPCIWFYDPGGHLPVSLCPLIIRVAGGVVSCLDPLEVARDAICRQ